MSVPPPTPREDELAAWLSARDEELAAGVPVAAVQPASEFENVQPRLARDLECVRLLRSLWVTSSPASESTAGIDVPPVSPCEPPQRIGRFEIRRELGAGGYGVVFLAFDPQLGRDVALKIPRAEALLSAELRSRFAYEARIAAGLDHPNIVPVYDAGEAGPVCYIASAYCPGVTLADWLRSRDAPVPFDSAARLVIALAEAMQHAHSRGVLHRDLKPTNVILTAKEESAGGSDTSGLDFVPRLTDFGLAKLQHGSQYANTRTHAVVGTAEYMSPEQATGRSREITTAADIYGLGVILYELITGCPPFRAESPLATLRRVESEEPPPPSRLRPDVPRDLETIVLKCLQKEPSRRYISAHTLAQDLRRFLAGEPVEARPIGRLERIARWCRRNRLEAALIAAATLALLSGTCISTHFAIQARGRRQAEISAAVAGVEAREAQAARHRTQQHLYLSQMLLAGSAWHTAEVGRLGGILDAVRPQHTAGVDYRRFEWYYWHRAIHTDLRTWTGDGPIYSLRLSPDDKLAAFAGERGSISIVDTSTGELRHVLSGHGGPVWGISFSAVGHFLATASDDSTIRVWNVATGNEHLVLRAHTADATSVAFAPQGMRLVSAAEDGKVHIWDASDGSRRLTYQGHSGPVWHVAFSPDGERVLSSGDDGAHVWNSHTGKLLRTLAGHDRPVYCAAITPDGQRIATASEDGTVRIWNFTNGEQVNVLHGHLSGVRSVDFSPDGTRLVSGGRDGVLRFWDANSGRELFELKGHQHVIDSVTFSADGRRIASASRDASVKLWDSTAPRQPHTFTDHQGIVDCAVFSPDGRSIASLGRNDHALIVHDTNTGRVRFNRVADWAQESGIAFDPHGQLLAIPEADYGVCLYDVESDKCIQTFLGHTARVRSVAFNHDGTMFASADDAGEIRVWEPPSALPSRRLPALSGPVYSIVFSPDGHWLVAAGPGKNATVFDLATGRVRLALIGHAGDVYSMAVSRDGSRIATGSQDSTARIWDSRDGRPLVTLTGHTSLVHSVAFNPDGSRLATGSTSAQIKLWDAITGQEALTLTGHESSVHTVMFSADGQRLLSASLDGTIKLWDARPLSGKAGH